MTIFDVQRPPPPQAPIASSRVGRVEALPAQEGPDVTRPRAGVGLLNDLQLVFRRTAGGTWWQTPALRACRSRRWNSLHESCPVSAHVTNFRGVTVSSTTDTV